MHSFSSKDRDRTGHSRSMPTARSTPHTYRHVLPILVEQISSVPVRRMSTGVGWGEDEVKISGRKKTCPAHELPPQTIGYTRTRPLLHMPKAENVSSASKASLQQAKNTILPYRIGHRLTVNVRHQAAKHPFKTGRKQHRVPYSIGYRLTVPSMTMYEQKR